MNKFYHKTEMGKIMEQAPITYFGCPFYLNIDNEIINYISHQMIWKAPFKTLIFTNSHLFTLTLFEKLISDYNSYSYQYEYNVKEYCFFDKNGEEEISEVQVYNFSSKNSLQKKVKRGYYDRVFFHFVDENIASILKKVIFSGKTAAFFTLDEDNSLFYVLNDEEKKHFYRLYDEESNRKIKEVGQTEIVDIEKEKLAMGLFETGV